MSLLEKYENCCRYCLFVSLFTFVCLYFVSRLRFYGFVRLKLTLSLIPEPTTSASSPSLYLSSLQSFAIEFL